MPDQVTAARTARPSRSTIASPSGPPGKFKRVGVATPRSPFFKYGDDKHPTLAISRSNLQCFLQLRTFWYSLVVIVLGLAVAGCVEVISQHRPVAGATQQHLVTHASHKGNLLSAQEREELRVLDANGGIYEDTQLQAMVQQIANRLAASSDAPELPYRVVILNSPAINAYSLASGRLFVTRGLLALANDSSELASVLSHEMAHITARHAAIRTELMASRAGEHAALELGAMAFGNSNASWANFSRSQELEADSIGARIAARAGYDPYGAVRFLNSLRRNAELSPGGVGQQSGNLSHPATSERLRNAELNAQRYATLSPGNRDEAIFLASIDGLIYGEGRSTGVVKGRQLLQPSLGFSFMAPEGFTLHQIASTTLGVKEQGSQALRIDFVKVAAEHPLTDYLTSGWLDRDIEQRSIEHLVVNGLPAVTATAQSDQWAYRVFVIRLTSGVCRIVFAANAGGPGLDQTFHNAVSTFRNMSPAEIEATTPQHLTIITVRPGDTPEKLASRMKLVAQPLERLLVINGLQPGQMLHAGDPIKMLTRVEHPRLHDTNIP
jgi:predicted Zn-dependent protease